MVKKIGVGLVGTGNIAYLHTLGYQDNPDAQILALCDLNRKRAESFREETKLPANTTIYTKPEDLFKDKTIDLVEILTPHASHEALAVAAAEAGKHISVQKPPAMTLSSYDRMVAAAHKAGVRFRVYENFRYHPPYVKAFEIVQKGIIGRVEAVNVRMIESVNSLGDYRGSKMRFPIHTMLWKIKENQNYHAPTLFDDGYHKHSLVQGFLGDTKDNSEPINAVRAWVGWQRLMKTVKVDSPAVVIYETKKAERYGTWNVNAVTNLPMHSNYFACDESLEITGSEGIIMAPGCTGNLFVGCDCGGPGKPGTYWFSRDANQNAPFANAGTWKSDCSMKTDWSQSFIDCTRHLASVLARDEWFDKKDPRPVLADQGRHLLRINIAIIRSIRTDAARVLVKDIQDGPGVAGPTDESDAAMQGEESPDAGKLLDDQEAQD